MCSYNSFHEGFTTNVHIKYVLRAWQISTKTSAFSTVTQKYEFDLNMELNHNTVKTLENYAVH